MLTLLLATALGLSSLGATLEDPPKAGKPEAAHAVKAEPAKTAQAEPEKAAKEPAKPTKKRTSIAIPEKEETPKVEAPHPAPTPRPRPATRSVADPKLANAEARAAKLAAENAKLQEALARKELPSSGEIRTPGEALVELKAGNARFAEGRRVRTLLSSQDPELRQALSKGQAPFAVIVTCSDSRLMDNFIFDQELGRLFTIREAGNCPDIQGVASVEYAVEHLGSKLVVVLGHTACGAVKAVSEAGGKPLPGNLWSLQAAMAGLLETTPEDPNESTAEHLRHLETNNAIRQAQAVLDRSELVRHLVSSGKLQVLPAVYDLASGKVRFLELLVASKSGEKAHH